MADKKYYWLKLKKDFFKRHDILIIESMPNGKDYILFYLKLLLESVSHEGMLRFSDTIPYNEEMLATITNTNVDIVRSAMKVFTELQLVEILDDSTIFMSEVEKMIGVASDDCQREEWRIRQQRHRDKILIQENVTSRDVTQMSRDNNVTLSREIDIEKDKEKDKEIEIEKKITKKERKRSEALPDTFYPLDEALDEAFKRFVEHRRKLKKPLDAYKAQLQMNKLNKLSCGNNDLAIKIINQTIDEGWQSFYELKSNGRKVETADDYLRMWENA